MLPEYWLVISVIAIACGCGLGAYAWTLWRWRPEELEERIGEETWPSEASLSLIAAGHHLGVQDDADTAVWLAAMRVEPPLCDQPARPPEGSDAWWAMAHAARRRHDRRRADSLWSRLGPALGADWMTLITEAEHELAEWHRLTDSVFESTSELPVLVGVR